MIGTHARKLALLACLLLACSDGSSPTESDGSTAKPGAEPAAPTDGGPGSPRTDGATLPSRDASGPTGSPDAELPDELEPESDAAVTPDASKPGEPPGPRTYSTDRTTFFGASRCEQGQYLLCEDFESEAPNSNADSTVWQTMGDRIKVESARFARGKQALHVTTRSSESLHFIRTTKVVPSAKNKLWGRLFFWVAARPNKFSHWTAIEATGIHPKGGTARMRFGGIHVPDVENRLDFNYDIWGGRPDGFHEVGRELVGKNLPDGMWHCLEWMLDVPAREARLFRDGSEEMGLASSKSIDGVALDFPVLDGLNIGMSIYQDIGSSTWDVWIDEVVVDTARIGCSN